MIFLIRYMICLYLFLNIYIYIYINVYVYLHLPIDGVTDSALQNSKRNKSNKQNTLIMFRTGTAGVIIRLASCSETLLDRLSGRVHRCKQKYFFECSRSSLVGSWAFQCKRCMFVPTPQATEHPQERVTPHGDACALRTTHFKEQRNKTLFITTETYFAKN